jgi:hypothetical protein
MAVRRRQAKDDPRPARGSFWILLVLAGFFLTVGLRQMLRPTAEKGASASQGQVLSAGQTSNAVWPNAKISARTSANFSFRQPAISDPLADSLAKLMQAIQAEDDPMKREQLIADFLASLKTGDMAGVLNMLKTAEPADFVEDLSRRLVHHWAASDPQDLAAWINNLPAGSQRQGALDDLAVSWANSQLTNAISWGLSLTNEDERNSILTAVANEAVHTDPVTALRVAVSLPAAAQSDELIGRAATEWASGDATNAVAWAEQIPDGTLRAKVLAGESVAWSEQDPESAATLAVQELPAGRLQEDAVVSIVQRWAQQQPAAAAAWVARFPEGSLRTAAIENLVTQWSQKDPAGAQQWLNAHL